MIYKPHIKFNSFLDLLHSFIANNLNYHYSDFTVLKQDNNGIYWIGFSSIGGKTVYYRRPVRCEADFSEEYQIELKEFLMACHTVSYLEKDFPISL